jgi:hypothetical protein
LSTYSGSEGDTNSDADGNPHSDIVSRRTDGCAYSRPDRYADADIPALVLSIHDMPPNQVSPQLTNLLLISPQ